MVSDMRALCIVLFEKNGLDSRLLLLLGGTWTAAKGLWGPRAVPAAGEMSQDA